MYKFTTGAGLSIEFPRFTWAQYKKLMLKIQATEGERKDVVKATVEALLEMGKPVLTDEQITALTINDFNQLNDMFAHMKTRTGNYKGGQFTLGTPIPVNVEKGEANITGFTFKAQTIGDAWEYLSAADGVDQAEMFIKKYGRHVGDDAAVKELPLVDLYIDMMDAADVLYIQENVAGKSQGGSATWTRL